MVCDIYDFFKLVIAPQALVRNWSRYIIYYIIFVAVYYDHVVYLGIWVNQLLIVRAASLISNNLNLIWLCLSLFNT